MRKQKIKSHCPINFAMEIFGDRWTLLVLRDMMFKNKQNFGEFLQSEEKIATNILANRLCLLENEGIIIKTADPSHGSKFIYKLTQKGIDLAPVLVELILWSAKHDKQTAADKNFLIQVERNKKGLIQDVTSKLKRSFK